MIDTAPLGAMLMNAFGAKSAAAPARSPRRRVESPKRRYVPINKPPPASALTLRNWRRSTTGGEHSEARLMSGLPCRRRAACESRPRA